MVIFARRLSCNWASIEEAITRWISAAIRAARGLVPAMNLPYIACFVLYRLASFGYEFPHSHSRCGDLPSWISVSRENPPGHRLIKRSQCTFPTHSIPVNRKRTLIIHTVGVAEYGAYLRSISRISKVSMMSPISMSLKLPRLIPAS